MPGLRGASELRRRALFLVDLNGASCWMIMHRRVEEGVVGNAYVVVV